MLYKQNPEDRVRYLYDTNQPVIHWGLRMVLAFFLLLIGLLPSLSDSLAHATMLQTISVLSLAVLGVICFLDVRRQQTAVAKKHPLQAQAAVTAERPQQQLPATFRVAKACQVASEVTAFAQEQKISRRTVELFILPGSEGRRYTAKAIAHLKAAGYAIRPHSQPTAPQGVTDGDVSLIGVMNGYVQVYLGNE
ncbi:MAG: hypothetical protein EOO14_18220 [Chitinophagaceae bacterium]|nr:MAG: hypothetical protein EOO14_18220 [Chitinophagaceae bacterium]